jgi:hypothetical protein
VPFAHSGISAQQPAIAIKWASALISDIAALQQ